MNFIYIYIYIVIQYILKHTYSHPHTHTSILYLHYPHLPPTHTQVYSTSTTLSSNKHTIPPLPSPPHTHTHTIPPLPSPPHTHTQAYYTPATLTPPPELTPTSNLTKCKHCGTPFRAYNYKSSIVRKKNTNKNSTCCNYLVIIIYLYNQMYKYQTYVFMFNLNVMTFLINTNISETISLLYFINFDNIAFSD